MTIILKGRQTLQICGEGASKISKGVTVRKGDEIYPTIGKCVFGVGKDNSRVAC